MSRPGDAKRTELAAIQRQLTQRVGVEWGYRMTQTMRNLLIFPNPIIHPVTPDPIEINAWVLAPKDESPEDRALRLDTFLGPGGFATREGQWLDLSRGRYEAPRIP